MTAKIYKPCADCRYYSPTRERPCAATDLCAISLLDRVLHFWGVFTGEGELVMFAPKREQAQANALEGRGDTVRELLVAVLEK